MDARAVAGSELLTEKSLLDKVLEKVVEKTDKAEKTCEKLMMLIGDNDTTNEKKIYCTKYFMY